MSELVDGPVRPILLIAGSLRAESFTTRLLSAARLLLPDDVAVEWADHIRDLPHYDADREADVPPLVAAARAAVRGAAGVLIATPEFNAAVPGGVKDWVDWLSRPYGASALVGVPVAIIGGSTNSGGGRTAVEWLRAVLGFLGADVVGQPVAVAHIAAALGDGVELEPATADALRAIVDALVDAARPRVGHIVRR